MDATTKTSVIAAIAAVVSAGITAVASLKASSASDDARATLKDATNLVRYVYDNGTITQSQIAGGKMVVRVNGSDNSGPVSQPIDMERFIQICGDADGCSLTLAASRFRYKQIGKSDYISGAPIQGNACRFFWLTETRAWSLAQTCVAVYATSKWRAPNGPWEYAGAYQAYEYSNSVGRDDSSDGKADPDGQPLIIMSFKGACYLAESAAATEKKGGAFLPDNSKDVSTGRGLYLIASSPTWDFQGSYPVSVWPADDSERRCELIVED